MVPKAAQNVEQRLQALEDQLAIYQLICGYGYAVDGCNAEAVGELYAEDGVYSISDVEDFVGRERIAAITARQTHLSYVHAGCAHISTLPYVVIEGDRAVATCHSVLASRREDGIYMARLSASRALLARKPEGGWEIVHRQMRPLDGDPAASAMLGQLKQIASEGSA